MISFIIRVLTSQFRVYKALGMKSPKDEVACSALGGDRQFNALGIPMGVYGSGTEKCN